MKYTYADTSHCEFTQTVNNTQFILHNSIFIIKFQFVLPVLALFPAILGTNTTVWLACQR